jgi:hypothetical protein
MPIYPLTDGSGKMLDTTKAEEYVDANIVGSASISKATLKAFERETLYRSASGAWILMHWTKGDAPVVPKQSQIGPIDPAEAMNWLLENGHHAHINDCTGCRASTGRGPFMVSRLSLLDPH